MSNDNVGELAIPVEGRGGIWTIEYHLQTFRGVCPPVFIKLLNVEPVVSFGLASLLPEGTMGKPVELALTVPVPEAPLEFTQGLSGQALKMSGNHTISFPKGESVPTGGYIFSPYMTGTVEFWFMTDRSTYEIPIGMGEGLNEFIFVKAPHINLIHRYFGRGTYRRIDSVLRMDFLSAPAVSPAGFQGEHYFRAGEWTHVAYIWDVRAGVGKMEGTAGIFLNGKLLSPASVLYGANKFPGSRIFQLYEGGNEIVIGPFDGSMDTLRFSDVVRYKEDFIPLKTAFPVDENTRALFLFDGDLKGVSAFSKEPIEAR